MLVMDDLVQLGKTERFEDWLGNLKTLTCRLGYSNFLLGVKPGPGAPNQQVLIQSNYPVTRLAQSL